MPDSECLKDFKTVWRDSCHSMWVELLSITMTESFVSSKYWELPPNQLLTDMVYVPEIRGRIDDINKDRFLQRAGNYRQSIVTNRVVLLSASFENYFREFLEAYLRSKPKFFDSQAGGRTAEGDKVFGEVQQTRGLSQKIRVFAEHAPAKIKSIERRLSYLDDVYALRNVLAHRAGTVDHYTAGVLQHLRFNDGDRITLSSDQLLMLAKPVVEIAEELDKKLGVAGGS